MKIRSRVIMMTAVILVAMALWLPALRSRRVAAQSPGLMGSYGFSATVPSSLGRNSVPFAILGVITFDGAGTLTGTQTVVAQDDDPNATTVSTQTQALAGTYMVNADGTGFLLLQNPTGAIPVAFVITDGGAGLMFLQTGGGNFLLSGTARKQ